MSTAENGSTLVAATEAHRGAIPTQVYRTFIRATPEAIWEAITTPEWTARYGYRLPANYDLEPGGAFTIEATPEMREMGAVGDCAVDGEVLEADPPRRLVQTYRFNFQPEMTAEGFTRVTWEIEPEHDGLTRLTIIHELAGAPTIAAMVDGDPKLHEGGGGWAWVLSDLKTLLESGTSLQGEVAPS